MRLVPAGVAACMAVTSVVLGGRRRLKRGVRLKVPVSVEAAESAFAPRFVSRFPREVLPVSCLAEVEAPVVLVAMVPSDVFPVSCRPEVAGLAGIAATLVAMAESDVLPVVWRPAVA